MVDDCGWVHWDICLRNPYLDENGNLKIDSEENKKRYELQQKQRAMERAIRKTNRELVAKQQEIDSIAETDVRSILQEDYDKPAAKLTKQNQVYNEFCKDNNLQPQYDRIKTADFTRKQEKAAKEAAKRYQKARQGESELDFEGQHEKITNRLIKNKVKFEKAEKDVILNTKKTRFLTKEEVIDKAKQFCQDILDEKEKFNYDNGNPVFDYVSRKLGYDGVPQVVDNGKFERLAEDSPVGVIYRGITADRRTDALKYVDEFKIGRMYAGKHSAYGHGTYFFS